MANPKSMRRTCVHVHAHVRAHVHVYAHVHVHVHVHVYVYSVTLVGRADVLIRLVAQLALHAQPEHGLGDGVDIIFKRDTEGVAVDVGLPAVDQLVERSQPRDEIEAVGHIEKLVDAPACVSK